MTASNVEMHNQVSRHLENNFHIIISSRNEWFKQCVDFFTSNNPNCSTKDLSSMVMEQLSLSDFQEIALSSLPPNLNNCEKKVLNGKYCLQVNTILDVGESCYSQYNVIVKKDTSNTEIGDTKPAPWEPKRHRMLKMTCSDGQQDILAMEYEPLLCLKEPFIPGFKISVVGPVEYRKGVLLLKSQNVHFIGGEVDSLLIKNAPLNVLCKALKKQELENPYVFSNIEVENIDMEVQESPVNSLPRQSKNVCRPLSTNEPQNNINQSNNSNFVGNGVITYDDFFDGNDDELLYLTQVAEIESITAQIENAVNSTPSQTYTHQNSSKTNKPTISAPTNNNTETLRKQTTVVRQTKISDMLGQSTSTMSNNSVAEVLNHQSGDRPIESNQMPTKQKLGKRIASSPLDEQFKKSPVELNNSENIWNDIFMDTDIPNPLIKVLKSTSVMKNSKIQVKQDEWICSGILIDNMNKIEVEFSSEVLERLIGISSKEVLQFKNNPLNCAPLKEKIEKGIKGAYRKLHLFKGEMTLTYSSDSNKKPIVTNMIL